jgi:hypothetical protein
LSDPHIPKFFVVLRAKPKDERKARASKRSGKGIPTDDSNSWLKTAHGAAKAWHSRVGWRLRYADVDESWGGGKEASVFG